MSIEQCPQSQTSPSILLLDEPTGDLDTVNTYRIIQLLYKIHQEGKTLSI